MNLQKSQLENLILPETDRNIAISLSGGIDSTTLLSVLVKKYGADRIYALSFDYNQRNQIELEQATKTAKRLGVSHQIIKLDYLQHLTKDCALINGSDTQPKTAEEAAGDPQLNTYVAFRNAQFAMILAAFAESNDCEFIAQGIQKGDAFGYWDTTKQFSDALNGVLRLNRENTVQFIAPFVTLPKTEVIKIGLELGAYDSVWSCYRGADTSDSKQCGHCTTCAEIINGYIQAGCTNEYIIDRYDITDEELEDLR